MYREKGIRNIEICDRIWQRDTQKEKIKKDLSY